MSANRQIYFNALDMNCVAHQSPGLWKHPKDHARDYNTIDYWVELAKTLEKGLFDGLAYVSGTSLNTAMAIGAIIVIGLVALLMDQIIVRIDRRVNPWRGK